MTRRVAAGLAAAGLGAAIALVIAAGPSLGPGPGTVGVARADVDEVAPVTETIGQSVRGRPITATRYGDATSDRVALVVGVIHGDEPGGLRVVDALRRIGSSVESAQLWVISTVNPDGLRARTRKNADQVDLNRNFPYQWHDRVPRSNGYYPGPKPASEPETQAVISFVQRIQPDVSIWYHQPWGAVLACHGNPQTGSRYAKLVHMRTSCHGNSLRGTAVHWEAHTIPGSSAFVVEFPAGRVSGTTAMRHARADITLAQGG
jgi:murein peptide amidase A